MDSGTFLKMKQFEVLEILKSMPFLNKHQWEMTRKVVNSIAQVNSSTVLKATDIMKFAWDEEEEETTKKETTATDIHRLEAKAQKIKEQWQI